MAEQAPAQREIRKTVTVLFCDVVDSTRLGARLDPESLRQVMGRYFVVAREALQRHGGTVEKLIGDAAMAVFGVPTLHEDDALRAVRAAADLRQAVREELNGELERDWGSSWPSASESTPAPSSPVIPPAARRWSRDMRSTWPPGWSRWRAAGTSSSGPSRGRWSAMRWWPNRLPVSR